jgi:murein DD-endopeptidase MepM/ murein hydrolase activator NlpD
LKFITYIFLAAFVFPKINKAEGEPKKDTAFIINSKSLKNAATHKQISKLDLINFIDSLLDLEVIEENDIELIAYYNSIINSKEKNLSYLALKTIPATNFYDDFDENIVFQVTNEMEFPETQIIDIESDSLGYYHHPKLGSINSKYGWRDGRMHKGIDISLKKGDAVVASFNGMVRIAKAQGAFGNVVIIRHYNGLETVYAHLSKIKVKPGQVVTTGQLIGLGGSTGRSSGPHLHFEVRFKGHSINPSSIISFTENKTYCNSIVIKKSKYGICAFPSNAILHTIEKGDTWYEVAKTYGLTMKELCLLNGTEKRYYLKIGQKLRVN